MKKIENFIIVLKIYSIKMYGYAWKIISYFFHIFNEKPHYFIYSLSRHSLSPGTRPSSLARNLLSRLRPRREQIKNLWIRKNLLRLHKQQIKSRLLRQCLWISLFCPCPRIRYTMQLNIRQQFIVLQLAIKIKMLQMLYSSWWLHHWIKRLLKGFPVLRRGYFKRSNIWQMDSSRIKLLCNSRPGQNPQKNRLANIRYWLYYEHLYNWQDWWFSFQCAKQMQHPMPQNFRLCEFIRPKSRAKNFERGFIQQEDSKASQKVRTNIWMIQEWLKKSIELS